jgi:hypothetical protein
MGSGAEAVTYLRILLAVLADDPLSTAFASGLAVLGVFLLIVCLRAG